MKATAFPQKMIGTPYPSLPQGEGEKRKAAFTLAEVLITLGIIGVVAAMTMPALIAKFQQKAFETGFKKQYAVLNNAIDFLILDQDLKECYVTVIPDPDQVSRPGNMVYSSNTSDCAALKDGLISRLKLTSIENNITYTQRDKVLSGGGVSVNRNVSYDSILRAMKSYMLPDGAVLMFRDDNANYYDVVCFVLDVNGEKGPNRWGYDVFWLVLSKYKNKIRLSDEYASLSEKGGSLPRNILMNKWSNEFSTANNNYYGVWGQ